MSLSNWRSRRVERTVGFVQSFVGTFRSAHVPFLAGSIAYAAFVSLLPLLVLAVIVAGLVGGESFVETIVGLAETYLSPTGQALLASSLEQATAQTGLSLLSVVVLLWAIVRLFRALDLAFSLLYGTTGSSDVLGQVVDGVVVLTAMLLAIAGTVLATVLFALVPALPYPGAVDKVLLVGFLTVALVPIYWVFPDRPLSIDEVLPGTVVAAVGWTVLEAGFQVYVGMSSAAELYGVIGGVILLVTWLYFGALTLLLGATVNVVLAEGVRPGSVDPSPV